MCERETHLAAERDTDGLMPETDAKDWDWVLAEQIKGEADILFVRHGSSTA